VPSAPPVIAPGAVPADWLNLILSLTAYPCDDAVVNTESVEPFVPVTVVILKSVEAPWLSSSSKVVTVTPAEELFETSISIAIAFLDVGVV